MNEEENFIIYTDASFDEKNKIGTYGIIVTKDNNKIKTITKKCRIQMSNSIECEIFAIYQAINLILSCYINKGKIQKFRVRTDCEVARGFFIEKNDKKIFQNNLEIKDEIKNIYRKICIKLSKYSSSFKIKWIPRNTNKIAHNHSYATLKKLKNNSNNLANEIILIEKKSFLEILTKITKKESRIIIYLFENLNEQKIISITQEELSKYLNLSITTINNLFKKLIALNVVEKVKNGKYAILI